MHGVVSTLNGLVRWWVNTMYNRLIDKMFDNKQLHSDMTNVAGPESELWSVLWNEGEISILENKRLSNSENLFT